MPTNTASLLLEELVTEYNTRVEQDLKFAERLAALGVTSEDFRVVQKFVPLPQPFVLNADVTFNRIGRGLHDVTQQEVKNNKVSKSALRNAIRRLEASEQELLTDNSYSTRELGS